MTIDDLIEAFRTFSAVNYPDREPDEFRLGFKDGKKIVVLIPLDQSDSGPERHAVEKCILGLLAGGKRVLYKNLKKAAAKEAACHPRTVDRYIRRLREDELIDVIDDCYGLADR